MKKLISLALIIVVSVTMALAQTNNPNQLKVRWDASPDTNVTQYALYYRNITVTNFSSTNINGRLNTNGVIAVVPNNVYELFVTARDSNGLESDPSNKIRGQNILVNGFGKLTSITVLDAVSTNVPLFQLVSVPSNGVASLSLPLVSYTATNTVGKDMIVFRSPEIFMNQNVTSYVSLYRAVQNAPTISIP